MLKFVFNVFTENAEISVSFFQDPVCQFVADLPVTSDQNSRLENPAFNQCEVSVMIYSGLWRSHSNNRDFFENAL